jgi:hypothetical protein
MVTMEQDRFRFLVNRDGFPAAIRWEKRTAEIYRLFAERALWPSENLGELKVARGKEWADIYAQAAEECEKIVSHYT